MKAGNIYLTGFMGCGKSTVGRILARRLKYSFKDTDSDVERMTGKSVAVVFSERGEAAFRKLERSALRSARHRSRIVVALGGGALMDVKNKRMVEESGVLVLLTCSEPALWRRLKPHVSKRPLLAGGRARARIRKLLSRRKRSYRNADFSISTTKRSPASVAALIARRLGA